MAITLPCEGFYRPSQGLGVAITLPCEGFYRPSQGCRSFRQTIPSEDFYRPSQGFRIIVKHFAGNYYHIYNRGCNREPIFLTEGNYLYLTNLIHRFLQPHTIAIIAYCLMPNHYHFLVRSNSDNAVARFIQRLFNSYAQAFNRQEKRTGTLFEGRAKSVLVDDESYLIELCRYMHLNPVVAGLVSRPEDWMYSNYLEWIGKRNGALCDREFIYSYFAKPDEYKEFIQSSIPDALARKLTKYLIEEN